MTNAIVLSLNGFDGGVNGVVALRSTGSARIEFHDRSDRASSRGIVVSLAAGGHAQIRRLAQKAELLVAAP